jgi:hypothetical protein
MTVVGSAINSRMILIGLGVVSDDDARIVPEPQPEHQHVPGFRVPPGSNLVAPSCVMLRTAQALGLVRAVSRGNCAVRPC